MVNYPFQRDSKLFKKYPKDNEGLIIKTTNIVDGIEYRHFVEFDLAVIKEYFPEYDDKEMQESLAKSVVNSIVRMNFSAIKL
jgi:hypothetical protein